MRRDHSIDLLKAAAIFGVVYIHTPGGTLGFGGLFRFCVPVFVTVWAAHFEAGLVKRPRRESGAYVRTRLVRLVVPYAFWSGLYLFLFHPLHDWHTTPTHTIIGGWLGGYGWSGQYFLIILFQLTFLFPLIRRCVTTPIVVAVVAAGLVLSPLITWTLWASPLISGINDRAFVYWLPYAVLGIGLTRGLVPTAPTGALIPLAVGLLVLGLWEERVVRDAVPRPSAYLLASVYLASVALVVGCVSSRYPHPLEPEQSPPSLRHAVATAVGRNTFPIFVANPLIIHALPTSLIEAMHGGWLGELEWSSPRKTDTGLRVIGGLRLRS